MHTEREKEHSYPVDEEEHIVVGSERFNIFILHLHLHIDRLPLVVAFHFDKLSPMRRPTTNDNTDIFNGDVHTFTTVTASNFSLLFFREEIRLHTK